MYRNIAHNSPARGRRAMTIIELSIGMVITTIVMAALSSLWFGVGHAWSGGSASQNVALTANQAVARLESTLRPGKYVFQWSAGSVDGKSTPVASVLFWKADSWGGSADGAVQIGELAYVEHDPVTGRLYLYQAMASTAMTTSQFTRASGVVTWTELAATTLPATFKAYDFVKKTVITEAVTGAAFNVPTTTTGARQLLEFTLTVARTGATSIVYGSTALRGPTTRPV